MDEHIDIASFPQSFVCPKTGDVYNILGFVNYIGSSAKTQTSSSVSTGHYTAICKRQRNWVVYDDLKDGATPIDSKYKYGVHPELLIFSKL